LVQGRLLSESDDADAPSVALVNEAFVAKYWPDEDPLGKRITWSAPQDPEAEWTTIVGVVADTHLEGLDAAAVPETFQTYAQTTLGFTTFVVRGSANAEDLTAAIRAAVLEVDPEQPISGVSTMQKVLTDSLGDRRFNMLLLGGFAGAALVMAAVGLYGVLSFSVAQRTREIGLRRALGAQPSGVVRMVVSEGLGLVVLGLVLGGIASIGLGRFISTQVYGVSTFDPMSYASGAILVGAVALFACLVPARRAAKTDPMVALRRT
jgi:putative ABC transport system permease protein